VPLRDVCTPQHLSDFSGDCAGSGREEAVSNITTLAQTVHRDISIHNCAYLYHIEMDMIFHANEVLELKDNMWMYLVVIFQEIKT
tara:strand:+ start:1183 stop:1437 length:255 start_codon:yes stop_codon:yes gene_type:complete